MKKILALIGSLGILTSTSLVVSCNSIEYSKKINGENLEKTFKDIQPENFKKTSLLVESLVEALLKESMSPKPENGKEGYEIKVLNNHNKNVDKEQWDEENKLRFVIVTYNLLETNEANQVNETASFSIINLV